MFPSALVILLFHFPCLSATESVLKLCCSLHRKLVLPTNPLRASFLFSIHCSLPSLTLPPSCSQHHSLGTHSFFSQVLHVAFPCISPSPYSSMCTYSPLLHRFYVLLYFTLALNTSQPDHAVLGKRSLFYMHVDFFNVFLRILIPLPVFLLFLCVIW